MTETPCSVVMKVIATVHVEWRWL